MSKRRMGTRVDVSPKTSSTDYDDKSFSTERFRGSANHPTVEMALTGPRPCVTSSLSAFPTDRAYIWGNCVGFDLCSRDILYPRLLVIGRSLCVSRIRATLEKVPSRR